MGVKALVYFEIVTTAATLHRVGRGELPRSPAVGVTLEASESGSDPNRSAAESSPGRLVETVSACVPLQHRRRDGAHGDMLQTVAFSRCYLRWPCRLVGEKGKPMIRAMESLSPVMFRFTNYVEDARADRRGRAAAAHDRNPEVLGVLV